MGDDKFEDYTKLKLLGEGAFGKAYLVEHKITKTQWVMKQLDLSAMPEKEKEATIKEAKILQILNHPNIVQFKDVYLTKKSKLCIVMEYADGGDLSMRIKSQKGQLFPENQILDWFTQICLSLKHVHDRKILHRDLKGQNIFLTKKNHIKLGDFGIARVLGSTLDKARTQVGTPYYLSPEIIESKPYSYSSDIWSLGAILYEMCTLKPPFDADSLHFLALKILKGQYAPISSQYSKDLKNLIQSMMQLQSCKRPNINQILKLPLITKRIQEFLTESVQKVEFAHTILHKQKIDMRCQLKDIKVIEESLPCPPQLLLQKQQSVPVIQNQQPQLEKSPQSFPEQNQKQKLQYPPQIQHQPQQLQKQQQQKQQPHPQPPQQQKVNQYPAKQAQPIKHIQPQKQVGPPQQIQKQELHKPATAQNFNKRSNSRNKVSEQEIKQKQEQERIKFQQIKKDADQKRKDDELKQIQQQQIKDQEQKRQREEKLKKQKQQSEDMRLDIQKRKKLCQNQSLQEQLSNENIEQQSQQQYEDLEEYNSDNEQKNKKENPSQNISETADKENSSDMDYGIQCENQKFDKDDIIEAKMFLNLEDVLQDVAEANNKVNELDYNNFEKQRIQILQNDLIAAVNDNDFEESDFSLTVTQNNEEIQKQNGAGLNYFSDPDRVNQLRTYLISGLGQQNVDQALKILKNELLQKTIEEVEQENNKNYYQSLLPFLSVQQTIKYIAELFQLVVFMDQSMS